MRGKPDPQFRVVEGSLTVGEARVVTTGVQVSTGDKVVFVSPAVLDRQPAERVVADLADAAVPPRMAVLVDRPVTLALVAEFGGVLAVPLAAWCRVHQRVCDPPHHV